MHGFSTQYHLLCKHFEKFCKSVNWLIKYNPNIKDCLSVSPGENYNKVSITQI